MTAALLTVLLSLSRQNPAAPATGADPSAERMAAMKEAIRRYQLRRDDDRAAAITLRPDPAFRLGRQGTGGILEGAIFLWTDPVGRPEAAVQAFLHQYDNRPNGEWHHEFTSLSTRGFVATRDGVRVWQPSGAGVTFQAVAGAPKPARSASQRLRQMRELAAEFRAEDDFGEKGDIVLRLLPTPITRYGKAGGTPDDGALFAFVVGTDPEVFLFLEDRPGPNGAEWQYAFAPMSCWPLKAEHKGKPVWSLPRRFSDDPAKPFFDRVDNP